MPVLHLTSENPLAFQSDVPTLEKLPPFTAKSTFRPNSITVTCNIQTPGIVVINQNYHRDWHTNQGELFNKDGLLALQARAIARATKPARGARTIRVIFPIGSFLPHMETISNRGLYLYHEPRIALCISPRKGVLACRFIESINRPGHLVVLCFINSKSF